MVSYGWLDVSTKSSTALSCTQELVWLALARKTMYLKKITPFSPYYTTDGGEAFLGDSLEFLPHVLDKSVDLILTSPPFALKRKKEYGNEDEDKYCDWFLSFAPELKRILKDQGSFVLDLGGAYKPGFPVRSIYLFDLLVRLVKETGFYLAQEFYHYNPARLPAPAEWVNVRRVRVKDSVNVVWWLANSPNPKADNRHFCPLIVQNAASF